VSATVLLSGRVGTNLMAGEPVDHHRSCGLESRSLHDAVERQTISAVCGLLIGMIATFAVKLAAMVFQMAHEIDPLHAAGRIRVSRMTRHLDASQFRETVASLLLTLVEIRLNQGLKWADR
jgi:hypothetical protein